MGPLLKKLPMCRNSIRTQTIICTKIAYVRMLSRKILIQMGKLFSRFLVCANKISYSIDSLITKLMVEVGK
jgi:hypothetical protein